MSPEEQRIKIAEVCGWNHITSDMTGRWPSSQYTGDVQVIPDYPNDLNAMHEAEKVLDGEQSWQYVMLLGVEGGGWCSTAAERAEAFLKTIGKWEDLVEKEVVSDAETSRVA